MPDCLYRQGNPIGQVSAGSRHVLILGLSVALFGHCTAAAGKEYVCVVRLHNAIESELKLAKVGGKEIANDNDR